MTGTQGDLVQSWLNRISGLNQWRQSGQRAPNKPLLLLYALGRLHNYGNSRVVFESDEIYLKKMLEDFGPPRPHGHSPEYAFSRMNRDRIWRIDTPDGIPPVVDSRRALVEADAVGRLPDEDEELLVARPELFSQTVQKLLRGNWPDSMHSEICERVGLELESILAGDAGEAGMAADTAATGRQAEQKRDPDFRPQVLRAYEYQCAMCGWDARLSDSSVALEAAHIQWKAYQGPDDTRNGLCLCVLHHRLFDRGVLGISPDLRVVVSQDFNGRGMSAQLVIELANQQITPPQAPDQRPDEQYIVWHQEQVFKSPARVPH
ncbi:phosphorothioated DNA-binding restriction endonuclease [Candidatus Poriferisocius sp.]|uniref:phosphorothioated DNA-binding restriction endonuclease n=1 Tax=Candidatus Poriferisocius sp. TaxID=3101276 RepID=UPI003B01408B